jgi:hypothetical protein
MFTRQLRDRANLALHATVGLDERLREVVEGLLVERLQQEAAPEAQRTDLALVAASLESLGPRAAAAAWQTLIQARSKTTDPVAQRELAQGLAAVAARLEPKDAARAASALTESSNYFALGELAARLGPQDAAQAASALTQAMTKTIDPLALRELTQRLSAVAAHLEPKEAARQWARTASALSQAMSKAHPSALPKVAQVLSATLTRGHLSTQELTNLLKQPFCVGEARRVVLKQLERRYRRTFADHWEFVRFAQQQNLGLDFTTPPRRPEAVQPEARK